MAGTLALINPAKSKKRKRRGRALPARNKKGRFMKGGGGGKRRKSSRRSTRRARRYIARRRSGFRMKGRRGPVYVRPRKGRKGRTVYRNPRRSYRRRRNPVGGKWMGLITSALSGAIGATLVRTGLNYLPAAAAGPLMNGRMRYVTQGAAAILLGIIAGMVPVAIVRRSASEMAIGALTVTLHDVIVNELGPMTGMNLGYWGSGYTVPGELMGYNGEVGEYVGPMAGMQGLHEYVPG